MKICRNARLRGTFRLIAILALVLSVQWMHPAASAFAERNLAANGNLSKGKKNAPADWYASSTERKLGLFAWVKGPGESSVLEIDHLKRNYSSWHQALILPPGIYRISAEARVEGATASDGGANIAVQTHAGLKLMSEHLHGTTDWHEVSLVLKQDRWGDTTELLCQLGSPAAPDTGRAWFRKIRVVSVPGPPPAPPRSYDLSAIHQFFNLIEHEEIGWERAAGITCGFILLAMLAWALAAIWRPVLASGDRTWKFAVGAMLAITAIKFAALFHFTGFYWDIFSKTNRAVLAATLGPKHIYDPGLPVDAYPPGSLYLLWLSGWLGRLLEPNAAGFRVIVETPPLIADCLIGLTLFFAAARRTSGWYAMLAMALFALNPGLIFDTVVWGQSDSLVALPMLAAALLVIAGRYRLGWIAAAIAVLVKPQALAILPPLGLWTMFSAGFVESILCASIFAATAAIGILPFQMGHPAIWIVNVYTDLGGRFSTASVGAFNFLGLIGGINAPDTERLMGVTFNAIGFSLLAVAYAVVGYLIWRARSSSAAMLATFLALFGFFVFAPRMHERYLYYPIVLLIPVALETGFLTAIFATLSATFLCNLIYVKHLTDTSASFPDHLTLAMAITALVNIGALVAVAGYCLRASRGPTTEVATDESTSVGRIKTASLIERLVPEDNG